MPKIGLDLDEATYRKLDQLSYGTERTPADFLLELIVYAVHTAHAEANGYHEYFQQPVPLSLEEAEAAKRDIVQPILERVQDTSHRPEAVIFGLIDAAYEHALALCSNKGWTCPNQEAGVLLKELIAAKGRARAMDLRKMIETDPPSKAGRSPQNGRF
jgi:hypothetical protein